MKNEPRSYYLTDTQLAARFSNSRNTIWRWVREGRLPAPVKLALGTTRWRLVDIEKFEAERAAEAEKIQNPPSKVGG